jgi:hypothetical protein
VEDWVLALLRTGFLVVAIVTYLAAGPKHAKVTVAAHCGEVGKAFLTNPSVTFSNPTVSLLGKGFPLLPLG